MKGESQESGNILFLILIAVALFAALSYAVTSSSRTSGGNTDKEGATLLASEILQYTSTLQNAITRMQVSNGCANTQFDFQNIYIGVGLYGNANSPANKSCFVFDPAGGNVIIQKISSKAFMPCCTNAIAAEYQTFRFVGSREVDGIGTTTGNPSGSELLGLMGELTKPVCMALNEKLGVTAAGVDPPSVSATCLQASGFYSGAYSGGGTNCTVANQPSACVFDAQNGGAYYFYTVLLPR